MTYEEILKIQDPIARFGRLSEFKDELEDTIRVIKPYALSQIRDEKGDDFTGRFQHTDGRTYEVRTDFDYPNIMDYDKNRKLSALLLERDSLKIQTSENKKHINEAIETITKAHPKMLSVEKRTLALIREKKNRKEAQNG